MNLPGNRDSMIFLTLSASSMESESNVDNAKALFGLKFKKSK